MRTRRAARVLLFDPSGDILLMRFAIPQGAEMFVFWAAPGGEIEGDESAIAAAQREIKEELGLELDMDGPIRTDHNSFKHRGELCDNTDFYFRAECERTAPQLTGVTAEEIEIMKEIRWWTTDELEQAAQAGQRVFPVDLPAWVRQLQSGHS